MKKLVLLVTLLVSSCPFSIFAQETGDVWDPIDDSLANAAELTPPSLSEATHGPHTLSATDVFDWFQVILQENVTVEFFASGDADTAAELFASDGTTQVASDDDNGPGINFQLRYQPSQSGTYYLRVRLYAPIQSGAYTLHYLVRSGLSAPPDEWDPNDDTTAGSAPIVLPAPTGIQHGPHTLSNTDTIDWFTFQLQTGETYQFRSIGNADITGDLYKEDGTTHIASDDDTGGEGNFRIVFTAPQTGSYFLSVRMFEEGFIGTYSLHVQSGVAPLPAGDKWDPVDDLFEGSTNLGSPTKFEQKQGIHTLSQTDRFDWFQFTLVAGAQYRFSSMGASDTLAELFQSDGVTLLGEDDNSGGENNFSMIYSPKESGKYFLRVRSFQDRGASYDLFYILLNEPTPEMNDPWDPADDQAQGAVVLNPPETQIHMHGLHTLSYTDREDWFSIDLKAGIDYEFWTSGDSDTVGELFQPDGTTGITQEDAGGSGYNFRIRFSPIIHGRYHLRVRMFDRGSRGTYMLHYSLVSPIPSGDDSWDSTDDTLAGANNLGAITSLEQQHGPHTLSSTDRADWFTLSLAVGAVYDISSTGNSDTAAVLFYSDGVTPATQVDEGGPGNNFHIAFSPAIAGTYYLKVYETMEGDAAYTLHAYGAPDPIADLQPYRTFNIQSPEEFIAIPGGYDGFPSGKVSVDTLPANLYSITDGKGAVLTAAPGQVILLQFPQVDVRDSVIVLRALVGSNGPGAAVALAALDGSLNGSIAANIPANSALFKNQYQWMTLLYDPPHNSLVPIVQLANTNGAQSVSLYLDAIEVYLLPNDASIPSSLFKPDLKSVSEGTFPSLPYADYNLNGAQEFTEQPGGFLNAKSGAVTIGEIPQTKGSRSDGIGATLTVNSGEVEMLLFPTVPIDEDIVLIRAFVQASGGGASIALAALDGSMDGSIAFTISQDSEQFVNGYQWIYLTYDPPGKSLTPLIQLANRSTDSRVSLVLDKVEVYRYSKGNIAPTRLLYGE